MVLENWKNTEEFPREHTDLYFFALPLHPCKNDGF